ncbi:MAG: dihydropteroate synthase, partial [Burkholderiaceae bacterium]
APGERWFAAGSAVVRVHDVQATVDALKVWQAVQDHVSG